MPYSFLADLVVVAHFCFILFVVGGGLLVLYKRRWVWLHLPAAIWGTVVEFTGWICPLTPLENWLRLREGGTAYTSGFVERYIVSLVYPSFLTRDQQIALGLGVVMVNGLIYGWIIWRQLKR